MSTSGSICFDVIDGNNKANFRNGLSLSVLYLWERVTQFDLLNAVCQQLSEGCSSFKKEAPVGLVSSKKRKANGNKNI